MERIVVCIPAYNPSNALLFLIESLREYAFQHFVIINDGSGQGNVHIFDKLRTFPNVTVIDHEKNFGKGRAVKTGIQHIIQKNKSIIGVLTCGADGQHEVEDILRIAHNAKLFEDGLIIGLRSFKTENLSVVYRIHNHLFSRLFQLLFQKKLLDLQSGLRFYPKQELHWVKKCPGERSDYDLNVLIEAIRRKVPIYELPIGKAKITKSTYLHYDEVTNPKKLATHLLKSFLKRNETFK